jgi:excisionase family DNA binding protein
LEALLTAREIQEAINVDKSTVYRMAEDGRLPGVKVGRQWRFPADQVAATLGIDIASRSRPTPPDTERSLDTLLDSEAVQTIADLIADLFGLMAVVTDMDGNPLTKVANACGYYDYLQQGFANTAHCIEGWKQLGATPDLDAAFLPTHLGFLCARTFIRVDRSLVGMVIVGGLAPPEWPPGAEEVARIAHDTGLSPSVISARATEVYDLSIQDQIRVLGLLPRVAALISQLAAARNQLLSRFDEIASLADPALRNQRSHS